MTTQILTMILTRMTTQALMMIFPDQILILIRTAPEKMMSTIRMNPIRIPIAMLTRTPIKIQTRIQTKNLIRIPTRTTAERSPQPVMIQTLVW